MIEQQPISLYWDSSVNIDEKALFGLRANDFKSIPISIAQLIKNFGQEEVDKSPKVVCLNSREEQPLSESLIQRVKEVLGPTTFLIVRVDKNDVESAIAGVRGGADEVVSCDADKDTWKQVAASARMRLLKFQSYVFVDELSQNLLALIERVGASDVTALLQGPTGSGKEVLARLVHDFSSRRGGPFIPVNCAALPESLAESLMFGHAKGSFTGATRDTDGFFSQANGGTLFLDEIGELQPLLQAKLLRAIQEREILPIGSSRAQRVDVRIVSATNKDLRALSNTGDFREDLYFRLSTFRINVPSLSARADDILPLANYFIVKHSRENQKFSFSTAALSRLINYSWPGNVRELENVVQRAIVLARDDIIDSADLIFDEDKPAQLQNWDIQRETVEDSFPIRDKEVTDKISGLHNSLQANEFRIIAETIKNSATKQAAAKELGISDRTLRYKLAKMRDRGFSPDKAAG